MGQISDAKLRQDRLVFYARDVARLDSELDGFLELSGARCALLIDKEGHLVTRRGDAPQSSLESISALVAGTFAATRELARLMGEEQFTTLFHQGSRDSIQVSTVGERALFAMVFDQRTNLGLVRYYAVETTRKLQRIMDAIASSPQPVNPGEGLDSNFGQSAAAALDKLF
jgi:predicted regulator of Ras-like GTPase activity (Roadblock/LC7/MglB family)